MSKFCPFCDDVKDSELDTAEKFKEHLEEEHKDEVIERGQPDNMDNYERKNGLEVVEVDAKEDE